MASSNTVYIIYNTAGQAVSAIQPSTYDGPGGIQQNSDLTLYGLGFPTWGQGADQNDYHLEENFACPDLTGYPLSPRYNPLTASYTPASELELNVPGSGINVPLVGQLWFNTTSQSMYVYTSALTFKPVETAAVATGPAPVTPTLGQLWFNQTILPNQLDVWNGSAWISVAANYLPLSGGTMAGSILMNGNNIRSITMAGLPLSTDVATVGYVNAAVAGGSYVPIAGGTMTGVLSMTSTSGISISGGPGLTTTGSVGVTVHAGTILVTGPTGGVAMTANGRIANVTTTNVGDAVSTTYANANFLNLAGGTVTGAVNFSGAAPQTPIAPSVGNNLTNKTYVDAQVASAVASFPAILAAGTKTNLTYTVSTAVTADPVLKVALAANSVYQVTIRVIFDSLTYGVTLGVNYSGGILNYGTWGWNRTGPVGGYTYGTSVSANYFNLGQFTTNDITIIEATVYTNTAGTIAFYWGIPGANGSSSAIRIAGSSITAIKCA